MKENKISIEITADGWKTDVTINGKTYSERHIGHYGSSECVEGSFDTQRVKLLCIPDDNHGRVDLCIKDPDCGWNIPIGQIKLFSRDLYRDFKETLPDATKLGEEIARRWNECETKK